MRALLDVNMLIALLDRDHALHANAAKWLTSNIAGGWASCPLTQNGCVRILSQPSYPNPQTANAAAQRLREATLSEYHQFWADDISLLDATLFDWQYLLYSRQLTDAYLLALAVKNNGVFVTLDQHIQLAAVRGAKPQHLVVL